MAREPLSFQETADPKVLQWFNGLYNRLGELITTAKNLKVDFPRIYTVQGTVKVDQINLPPIEVKNFPDLNNGFKALAFGINTMQEAIIRAITSQKFEAPKSVSVNSPVEMKGMNDLLEGIYELEKGFNILIKATQESKGLDSKNPMQVEIVRSQIPQLAPPAVTNVNINPLQGFAKSTATTVGTTLTKLPAYGQLFNRRSLIIFNNSSNTIFYGGSDVTASNGFPVLANTSSKIIDAGYNMIIYGIASQESNNVRVIEFSKDQADNVQQ